MSTHTNTPIDRDVDDLLVFHGACDLHKHTLYTGGYIILQDKVPPIVLLCNHCIPVTSSPMRVFGFTRLITLVIERLEEFKVIDVFKY